MTPSKKQTEEEMLREKYDALMRELGPNGFIDYIQQTRPGKGDYTAERQQPDSLPFEEFHKLAAELRAENGDVSAR